MSVVCLFAFALQQTDSLVRTAPADPNDGRVFLWIAIAVALIALILAFLLARSVIA